MPTAANRSINPELLAGAALLERGSESVRAVIKGEQNRFTRVFDALNRLALATGNPLAVVDEQAAIHFGYPAITEDVDIVAAHAALDRLLDEAPQYGFEVKWRSKGGWHTLTFEDVEINIVPEGGRSRDSAPSTIPGPSALGVVSGLGFADLPGWIELKISSGRAKDKTHVVEVLKTLAAEQIAKIRSHIATVHARYAELFDQLIAEADGEKRQEYERGKERE